MARERFFDVCLPLPLGGGVNAAWVGRIRLQIGRAFGAVEDHVGADVDKWGACGLACDGDVAGALGVDGESCIRLALRAVYVGVGGGVDNYVGFEGGDS